MFSIPSYFLCIWSRDPRAEFIFICGISYGVWFDSYFSFVEFFSDSVFFIQGPGYSSQNHIICKGDKCMLFLPYQSPLSIFQQKDR